MRLTRRLGKCRHRLERRAQTLVVLIVEVGRPVLAHLQAAVVHPDARQPLRFAVRQRLEDDVPDDAEERGVGADAERERDDRQARQSLDSAAVGGSRSEGRRGNSKQTWDEISVYEDVPPGLVLADGRARRCVSLNACGGRQVIHRRATAFDNLMEQTDTPLVCLTKNGEGRDWDRISSIMHTLLNDQV